MRQVQKGFWMVLLAIVLCWTNAALAQEAPLTPEQEEELGVDAGRAAQLKEIFTEKSRVQGEEPLNADVYTPSLDITRVLFGHVASNRWLWAFEFAADFQPKNATLIFYLDSDNNPKTGRNTGILGPELIVALDNGVPRSQRFRADGSVDSFGPTVRSLVLGQRVYLSLDTDLFQQEGQSLFRMMLTTETVEPRKSVDFTPFFTARGGGVSGRLKLMGAADVTENQNMITTWGLHLLNAIQSHPQNVVLPILSAETVGFKLDFETGYRAASVTRTETKGRITAKVPRAGTWYPAFIFYDGAGAERMALHINGQRKGIAVALADDNNQKLFTLKTPVALKAGDTIELRNLDSGGRYRTEDLLLLKALPVAGKRTFEIRETAATVSLLNGQSRAGITFITNWDVVPRVEWGTTNKLGQEAAGPKDMPLNNHRIYLDGLQPNQKYFYRIVATGDDGKTVTSEVKSFSTALPKYPAAKVTAQRVPLSLSTKIPAGQTWPVTTGVPLPQGQVYDAQNLRVLNASGREIPSQIAVLGRWRDSSIKWALLDLQAASSDQKYFLEYGSRVRRAAVAKPIKIEQAATTTKVDTGALRLVFDSTRSGLFTQIARDLNGDGLYAANEQMLDSLQAARIELVGMDGKTYSSVVAPDEIAIEESGPLRTVVRIRGAFRAGDGEKQSNLFRYTLRLHVFAGSPVLKMQATLENSEVSNTFTSVKSMVLRLPLAYDSEPVKASIGGANEVDLPASTSVSICQDFDNHFSISSVTGDKAGTRAPGWAQWQSGDKSVTLAVRDFWQQYPKSLKVSADSIEIGLMPPLASDQYAKYKGTVEEYRTVFYLLDGAYKFKQGMTKTHDILLSFDAAGQRTSGEILASLANSRPLIVATPEWFRDTRVFGDITLPGDHPRMAAYEESMGKAFQTYVNQHDPLHEYGMLNWGDWWGERGVNWGNNEYDTQHVMFLQFARNNDPRYFLEGEAAELHTRDVDTIHYDARPEYSGRAWIHAIGHVGGYFPEGYVPGVGFAYGGTTVSHTWTQGHAEHYFLTGDPRSLETARKIADVYGTNYTRNYDFDTTRDPGWHLILTMAVYKATNDPFYLNAARIIVERVLERQTTDGGWRRLLTSGHCDDAVKHYGEAGFMIGILMSGLKYYHEETGDPRVLGSIVKGSHFLIDDMWVPRAKAFRYTSCPNTLPSARLSFLVNEGMVYAWRHTKNPGIRKVMLEGLDPAVQSISTVGRYFTQQARAAPLILFDTLPMLKIVDNVTASATARVPGIGGGNEVTFDASTTKVAKGSVKSYKWDFGDGKRGEGKVVKHRYLNAGSFLATVTATHNSGEESTFDLPVSILPPVLQNADSKQLLLVEAEKFTAQGKGEVSVMRDRNNTSGEMITYWEQTIGHWLEWKVNVPQTGKYKVVLKYATAATESKRDFQIDGKFPHPSLQSIVLPGTGGYSANADNWKLFTLGGDEKPLEFEFAAGEHTLRMSNLSGGLGLDYILLTRVP